MRWLRRVGSEEVIAAWLKHEYQNRTDFKAMVDSQIPQYVGVIANPNLGNIAENQARLSIITQYRPFVSSIAAADWWVTEIDKVDFTELKLIDSGDWRFITDETPDPTRAAKKIDKDTNLRNGIYSRQVSFILNRYKQLSLSSYRIVIVCANKEGPFTVVDGVHRTVAMALYHFVRVHEPFAKKEAYAGLIGRPFDLHFS